MYWQDDKGKVWRPRQKILDEIASCRGFLTSAARTSNGESTENTRYWGGRISELEQELRDTAAAEHQRNNKPSP